MHSNYSSLLIVQGLPTPVWKMHSNVNNTGLIVGNGYSYIK